MMNAKTLIVGLSAFALCLALTSGSVLNFDIQPKLDRDEFYREYENASCTIFQVLFGSTYQINETTTCRCTERNLTTCKTVITYNKTTTTTPPPTNKSTTAEVTTSPSSAAAPIDPPAAPISGQAPVVKGAHGSKKAVEAAKPIVKPVVNSKPEDKFADFSMAFL